MITDDLNSQYLELQARINDVRAAIEIKGGTVSDQAVAQCALIIRQSAGTNPDIITVLELLYYYALIYRRLPKITSHGIADE